MTLSSTELTCKDHVAQFAFLQQVHRGILSSTGPHGQQDREVQEGGAGLDLFLQRSFFFGTAPRFDALKFHRPASSMFTELSLTQARLFLERYKAWYVCDFLSLLERSRILPIFILWYRILGRYDWQRARSWPAFTT